MSDGKIFKSQDYLQIRVYTGISLSSASTALIKYTTPSGTSGSWAATIEDSANGIIERTFTSGSSLNESGEWTFWSYITFDDTRVAAGQAFKQMIYDEGS